MTDNKDSSGSADDKYQRPETGSDAVDAAQDQLNDLDAHAVATDLDKDPLADAQAENPAPPEASAPAPQKVPSRIPGYLGLLLGLGALGLAGYLYFLTQLQDPLAPFEKRIDELATRAEANSGEVTTQSDAIRQEMQAAIATQTQAADSLRAEIADQQENLEAAQAALAESLGETITAQPPTNRDWKLAEVDYLLRVANHRLLMERDAVTAGRLLTTADKILAELGDFSVFDVRARLADEILSLSSLTGTDLQGLYLQLEALKNGVKSLPPRLPEYLQASATAPGDDLGAASEDAAATDTQSNTQTGQNVWQEMGERLSAFFQYRKIDASEAERALLTPDQTVNLEMNLLLMLERAQLALMRRNQLVYEQSLGTAEDWIVEYMDPDAPAVIEAQSQLAELMAVELELPIPDISGSLTALEAVSRGNDE